MEGPTIVFSIISLSVAAIFVLRGPLGKALADRLAGRSSADDVEALRQELTEVQERLDFAERMLARQDERALSPADQASRARGR